ncbi:DUF6512 family protein [Mycoplasmatota bacterium WC44]
MIIKKLSTIEVWGASIVIFLLGFFIHEAYSIFGNSSFASIFPVNESVWEHLKIFYWGVLIVALIQLILIDSLPSNFWFAKLISILVSAVSFILLYFFTTDVFFNGEHDFIATVVVFCLAILLGQFTSYKVLISGYKFPNIKEVSIGLIILIFIAFVYLTFNPMDTRLFHDETSNSYGITEIS